MQRCAQLDLYLWKRCSPVLVVGQEQTTEPGPHGTRVGGASFQGRHSHALPTLRTESVLERLHLLCSRVRSLR